MQDIKVSVYCLAYNHEKYIRKTLDGFVSQKTSFDFEVIVHDDASTDGTANIIREYAEKYPDVIKPIYQKENQYSKKVSIGKNYIYPAIKGKYIAKCEGDDYWCDERKLQLQFDALEAHPECSFSTHKVSCCDEEGKMLNKVHPDKVYRLRESGVITERELADCYWILGRYPFHTSSYFCRKVVLCRLYEELCFERTYDVLWLKAALKDGSLYYINLPMSVRRMDSVGNWNSKHNTISTRETFNKYMEEADVKIDMFLGRKYHDVIYTSLLLSVLRRFKYYPYEAHDDLVRYGLFLRKYYKAIPRNILCETAVKYLLLMYAPKLCAWLYRDLIKNVDTTRIRKDY